MTLILGLGNPGKQYARTWHNLGFETLNQAAQKLLPNGKFSLVSKWRAELVEALLPNGKKAIFAKPQTFMNESGACALALLQFFKLAPTDLWVVHDDLDLPLGVLKISVSRGSAGHKGVESIMQSLGSENFSRFRVGIQLPEGTKPEVLDHFQPQNPLVEGAIKNAAEAVIFALENGIEKAAGKYNQTSSTLPTSVK